MPWELWRQDDNGRRFLIGCHPSREAAERQQWQLCRGLHKQFYWIEENPLPGDEHHDDG